MAPIHRCLVGIACSIALVSSLTTSKPHIVLVVVDDLGWLDVGFHNGSYIDTPVLNALVRQGVHFDHYYGHSICTPSRAAIFTSRFASHTGLQHSYMTQGVNYSLPLKFNTIADHFNQTGEYACHMVGKHHLGFASQAMIPTSRGFSSFLGYLGGGEDYYTHASGGYLDFSDGDGCRPEYVGNYSTHVFANHTLGIIATHTNDQQLFLYLPFQSVHSPLEAPADEIIPYAWLPNKNRQTLGAMATDLDTQLGRVVDAFKARGWWNNTLLWLVADNGGPPYVANSNWPMRGGKWTSFEGGTHLTAFAVHGGGLLPSKNFTGLAHHVDLAPTLLAAAGYTYNDSVLPAADGVNLWPAMMAEGDEPSPRDHVLLNVDQTNQQTLNDPKGWSGFAGIVVKSKALGHWKLQLGNLGIPNNWCWPPLQHNTSEDFPQETSPLANAGVHDPMPNPASLSCGFDGTVPANVSDRSAPILFNLATDPRETTNVVAQYPEVHATLLARLQVYIDSAVAPLNELPAERRAEKAATDRAERVGCWGPWLD